MKHRIPTILTAIMLTISLLSFPQIKETSAYGRLFYATVSDGNTHLLPDDYAKTLKDYEQGTLTEVRSRSEQTWKNDYVNSRIDLILLNTIIPNAELITEDLIGDNGKVISKDNVTATYLSKVNTLSEAYPDIDYEIFDVISHDSVRDLQAGQLHEAWVQIYIPKDAVKGTYTTTISLKSEGDLLAEFNYTVEVMDLTLTDPDEWQTYLDLWTYPYASNRHYSGQTTEEYFDFVTPGKQDTNPYSYYYVHLDEEYQAGLESELALYAKAGGDTITVTIVEDPWNSRYPCPCPSMVKWTKKTDGTFTYDYTDMDYWIELNMAHGIDGQINLYSLAGVGWGFVYYDEATGTVKNTAGGYPGADEWEQISLDFLEDLIAHLEEKGWFDIACLYMDERTLPWTTALIEVAEQAKNSEGKSIMVGGAVNAGEVSAVFDRMDDISIWEVSLPDNIIELAEERRENGQRTTIYTCGSGKMSATNQPAEAAYAVYESLKYNTDGILRWALNKYDYDPLHAECHEVTYPGDCYLIYPDEKSSETMQAMSTPRFEKLCEGMRGVEKLRILKSKDPSCAASADALISSLGDQTMVSAVTQMKDGINQLSYMATRGDANDDGVINIIDITLTARYIVQNGINGSYDLTDCDTAAMDANCDGVIDQLDLNLIAESIRTNV